VRFSRLLRNGAISGAAAGVAAALVMWLHTEPVVRRALAVEDARAQATGEHEHELVSRGAQVFFGACTAALAGVLVGLVFAVVFARTRHRLPGQGDHARALWLAAFGFGAFTLMPALAIPANPPAVGDPSTVTRRTLIYVLSILVALLVAGAVAGLDRVLAARGVDPPVRSTADLVATVVLAAVALWLLPASPDTIPADVPAALVWDFRLASLAQLATMWAVLAVVFGLLTSRSGSSAREPEPAASR
jgi:predicted cobalt transporter CbtA